MAPVFLIYLAGIAVFTYAYVWAKQVWGNSWMLMGLAFLAIFLVRLFAIWAAKKISSKKVINGTK